MQIYRKIGNDFIEIINQPNQGANKNQG